MSGRLIATLLLLLGTASAAPAQLAVPETERVVVTESDYERAARFMSWNVARHLYRDNVRPNWLSGDRFWYSTRTTEGMQFYLVDPARGERRKAFDHSRLAAALTKTSGVELTAHSIPAAGFELADDARSAHLRIGGERWECDLTSYQCVEAPSGEGVRARAPRNSITSPDGRYAAFIRDHDLWVADLEDGREIRLTTDGVERYGYATDNQGWSRTDRPVLRWSPDSRSIATYRLDERGVEELHVLETREGRGRLHSWPYALPGDSVVPMLERIVIHLDGPRIVHLDVGPDHQRASSCCGMKDGNELADVEWSEDASRLAFASVSRDYKDVALRIADAETGAVRTVIRERGEPFFEASPAGRGSPNWRVLYDRNEILWFSQRDGWGHLYVYDLETGDQKRRLTEGEWNVLQVVRITDDGWLYFTGVGREKGRDPYYRHLYRVRLDGGQIELLTPEAADHQVTFSPSGEWIIDRYSTIDTEPTTVLRRADGKAVANADLNGALVLEEVDISELLAQGWPRPIPFTVKARDGETDLYGVMYRPSNFDPTRRYPIINHIYPGPQAGSIGARSFNPGRGNAQALAELGFIVVQIDALGTPMRSKEFHAAYYGDMGDNGLEDQIAGMRELAEKYEWIDIDRAGIFGHSGGGFASTAAILRYPDFFKVAVSSAGNHDNRGYTYYWGEKWHGLLERDGEGDNYERQANHLLAGNLRGKLLLAYGTMDTNVHPDMTLLVIDELIRQNKDFDLIVMPNRGHGFSGEPYMIRRTWDYFVEHLLGAEPPREFDLGASRRPVTP